MRLEYLWTVATPEGDELVYYVGETARTFVERLTEHLKEQLSGAYRIYDPEQFVLGRKELLWGGLVGARREASLAEFVMRLPSLAEPLSRLVQLIRFHLAPTERASDVRRRIEAALADHFYAQGGVVGDFQDSDIYYDRAPVPEQISVECRFASRIRGAPSRLTIDGAGTERA